MGGREKQKAKLNDGEEERLENGVMASKSMVVSSDDEEANEDLSLKIVEKALLMRAAKLVSNDVVLDESTCQEGSVVDLPYLSSREAEIVAEPSRVNGVEEIVVSEVVDLNNVEIIMGKKKKKKARNQGGSVIDLPSLSSREAEIVAEPIGINGVDEIVASEVVGLKNVEIKMEKKKKKKARKLESGEQTAIVPEEKVMMKTMEAADEVESVEGNTVQIADNIVLRKLLRGPRYFDPPDSGWGACYNCGEEGHTAVNCTAAKRKKPCFVCGSLEHNARQCSKGQDCFICRKDGHRAKDCPEKHKGVSQSSRICLKCGNTGHDTFSCKNDYPPDDFKEIQCYFCKKFGHLCCANSVDTASVELSCYRCGQLGHSGLACSGFHGENTGAGSSSSCYKCGEGGHFARECMSSSKAFSSLRGETTGAGSPSSCYKCGEEGHFARECTSSAKGGKRNRELSTLRTPILRFHREQDYVGYQSVPHDVGKDRRKKKVLTEEKGFTTPRKLKHRGGWVSEDPGDFSPVKPKNNRWRYSATPFAKDNKVSSSAGSHTWNSRSPKKVQKFHDGTSMSQRLDKGFKHRYSASRFDNFSNGGMRRNYDWS
ncbi:zinc finger CCHC domain-containing protein 7-like [Quillaja saponaria]|uniref:Zinc finger CCHC domain-containing protein 7-like n=1 Tax=Quillaja saponaria TaxID=32244 RepID=A0AAD7LLL1_QUISA|nr:zinc finger CCHC domain-containing protein 7-like [Quillaja saponaria]